MYIIHLEWRDLAAHIRPGAQVWMQDYAVTRHQHGIAVTQEHNIVVTLLGVRDIIHAARIRVETVSLLGEQNEIRTAANKRRQAALERIDAEIRVMRGHTAMGLLLTPGLRDDLEHYNTNHPLWTWENIKDHQHRRLVPVETQEDAV
jgi:hypothetical protein